MSNIEKLAKILKEELIPELDENLEEIMDIIDSGNGSKDDKDELKYLEEMKAYFDEVELDIANNNITEEDALDYFYFNVSGGYVGEKTPIWCYDDFA